MNRLIILSILALVTANAYPSRMQWNELEDKKAEPEVWEQPEDDVSLGNEEETKYEDARIVPEDAYNPEYLAQFYEEYYELAQLERVEEELRAEGASDAEVRMVLTEIIKELQEESAEEGFEDDQEETPLEEEEEDENVVEDEEFDEEELSEDEREFLDAVEAEISELELELEQEGFTDREISYIVDEAMQAIFEDSFEEEEANNVESEFEEANEDNEQQSSSSEMRKRTSEVVTPEFQDEDLDLNNVAKEHSWLKKKGDSGIQVLDDEEGHDEDEDEIEKEEDEQDEVEDEEEDEDSYSNPLEDEDRLREILNILAYDQRMA